MKYEPITVSELNNYIKEKFEDDEMLKNVLVKGEISNFKHHYTGHMYFTIKDDKSLIKCIMFKSYTTNLNFVPKDGMNVIVLGTVSVFERDGAYQIYCKAMQDDGLGNLYTLYEKLKKDLEEEGLFSQDKKKKIPLMPKVVGVLTSQTGSVIKDIINVSTRRNPNVYIRLFPVPVQGEGAKEKIAEAIKIMNENKLADVLILARGGGSLEDLWPFNEEIVARAIFNSRIPIISAVGHETDFTIADFVADLRAPTPSAAAELAVPDMNILKNTIQNYKQRNKTALIKKVEIMKIRFEKCMMRKPFSDPLYKVDSYKLLINRYVEQLKNKVLNKYKDANNTFNEKIQKIDALSPLKTLARGYSIVIRKNGIIKTKKQLEKDDIVELTFVDGKAEAKIL